MKNSLPVELLQKGLEEVQKSVERLFYWAAWADKFGGTVQETQIYGTVIKVIVTTVVPGFSVLGFRVLP